MKKKLGVLISLGVVAVIAVAVVVMYLVPVNYAPKISKPDTISVYKESAVMMTYENNSENYNELMNEINKSFTRSSLSALFAGQINGNVKVTDTGELPSELVTATTQKYPQIILRYNEAQTITINGKEQNFKVNEVVYMLTDSKTFEQTTVYLKQKKSGESDSVKEYYYKYSTFSMQTNLYSYVNDVVFP